MHNVFGFMSANTGFPPANILAFGVEMKVFIDFDASLPCSLKYLNETSKACARVNCVAYLHHCILQRLFQNLEGMDHLLIFHFLKVT